MLILIIFSMLFCASMSAGQNDTLEIEGPYILPRYPDLPWRAGISGNYEVEVQVEKGFVKDIRFLSNETITIKKERIPETNSISMDFVRAIDTAIRSWKFRNMQVDSFRLAVRFQLSDTFFESGDTHNYTVYRVDEESFRPPTRITIDAHRPLTKS